MPYNQPDPTDPNVLVGVVLPGDAAATREMAYVFAEEYARMGYDGNRLLGLFRNPFYTAAHNAYRALGEKAVQSIIEECIGAWGGIKISISDFGFSIEEKSEKSKIRNPKSKMEEGGGSDV